MTGSIRCIIIEDDELDRLVLLQQIRPFENMVLLGCLTLQRNSVIPSSSGRLIIPDINPGMNGIEFRK